MSAHILVAPQRPLVGWPDGRPAALGFLPRLLFADRWPAWRYILVAWPLVAVPTLLLGCAAARLLPGLSGPSLGDASTGMILFSVVFLSPLVETLLMTGPVALIDRVAGPVAAAVGSALLWAGAHSLMAARWGLVIWWPFMLFSIAYLSWRGRGYWRAVGLVGALHALNNAGPIVLSLLTG